MNLDLEPPEPETPEEHRASAEVGNDGATVTTGALSGPLTDWTPILEMFQLDPDQFEVVDDSVRMSTWQQSKRLANGDRDTVQLYSYRARFRRIGAAEREFDIDAIRDRIWRPPAKRKATTTSTEPARFNAMWADWQIGKSGTQATLDRIEASHAATKRRIKDLRRIGRNLEDLLVANMGDPREGCYGQYESQLATTEMTEDQQTLLVLDLWAAQLLDLIDSFDFQDVEFASVLCNHGERSRKSTGGRSVTSDSDNDGGLLPRLLERILAGRAEIRWNVPHDNIVTTTERHGVKMALTHGHKISGDEHKWILGQSVRVLRSEGREPDLWVTAHRHHHSVTDFGSHQRIQCPTQDPGSKYFTDATGKWSTQGQTTFVTAASYRRGHGDLEVV